MHNQAEKFPPKWRIGTVCIVQFGDGAKINETKKTFWLHKQRYNFSQIDNNNPLANRKPLLGQWGEQGRVAEMFKVMKNSHGICKTFQGKRDGFFIECGALDGESISNTLLFEIQFGWLVAILLIVLALVVDMCKFMPGRVGHSSYHAKYHHFQARSPDWSHPWSIFKAQEQTPEATSKYWLPYLILNMDRNQYYDENTIYLNRPFSLPAMLCMI